jgi:hypothetical protein
MAAVQQLERMHRGDVKLRLVIPVCECGGHAVETDAVQPGKYAEHPLRLSSLGPGPPHGGTDRFQVEHHLMRGLMLCGEQLRSILARMGRDDLLIHRRLTHGRSGKPLDDDRDSAPLPPCVLVTHRDVSNTGGFQSAAQHAGPDLKLTKWLASESSEQRADRRRIIVSHRHIGRIACAVEEFYTARASRTFIHIRHSDRLQSIAQRSVGAAPTPSTLLLP